MRMEPIVFHQVGEEVTVERWPEEAEIDPALLPMGNKTAGFWLHESMDAARNREVTIRVSNGEATYAVDAIARNMVGTQRLRLIKGQVWDGGMPLPHRTTPAAQAEKKEPQWDDLF